MKAKMYTLAANFEVQVSNKSYASIEGEDKKAFLKRVKVELEKDFDEAIDITEVKVGVVEQLSNELLIEGYKVAKGLREQIILAELTVRNISVEKVEKTARKKVEKVDKEVMMQSEAYLTAKANVGKLASYVPTKKGEDSKDLEPVNGVVKSISLNKTNTIIYYNIASGSTLRCCTAKNETLVFHEF